MKIIIHRGKNQIGGSVIEIVSECAKIIFDAGVELDETDVSGIPDINGLFGGKPKYNAVFLSHYHTDHIGLAGKILKEIPIYMGEKAFNIINSSNQYRRISTGFTPIFMRNGEPVFIEDIKITPISCDHSAFDSYMLLAECGEEKLLYTGDFRANGRGEFSELLKKLPKVDTLITEGTTLSRDYMGRNIEEKKLEEIGVDFLKKYDGSAFIFCSSSNIDRLITASNIAERTGRIFLEDVYTAQLATRSGVSEIAPKRNKIYAFQTDGSAKQHKALEEFKYAKIGRPSIAKQSFLMTVRPSMTNYLNKLSEDISFKNGVFFYALWKGYQGKDDVKEFVEFMERKGCKTHVLHTSGHADSETVDELVAAVSPKKIIPVHTENAEYFKKFSDNCDVLL
ncbi:MAG: MBL fold metallo-hydrolase [Ruminococcus sp.]|nr:MBL fold metallo-hydrolase [Ruminococcus sp.]MCM1380501.1 MBL fold metallo-hydrolase [Muribaculaceae bacterium]MCM1478883.1 MBL fold metallo-hydrolase [Muribaculaceae bacterium]